MKREFRCELKGASIDITHYQTLETYGGDGLWDGSGGKLPPPASHISLTIDTVAINPLPSIDRRYIVTIEEENP